MLPIFDGLRDLQFFSVLARLILSFLCGLCIGLERSYKNRPAGFRTHILVAVGSSIASVTGLYLYLNQHLPTDMSRIGAQIITGLGFIGGGTILVTKKETVKGLTTAAGLWTSGIIGLAIGAGFYEGGLAATGLVLLTQTYFAILGQRIKHAQNFKLLVHYDEKRRLDGVLRYLKDEGASITNLQITGTTDDDGSSAYSALITVRPGRDIDQELLLIHLRGMDGLIGSDILEEDPRILPGLK